MMAENNLMEKRTRSPIIGILTHKEREEGGKIIIAGLCVVTMQGSRELLDKRHLYHPFFRFNL